MKIKKKKKKLLVYNKSLLILSNLIIKQCIILYIEFSIVYIYYI